MQIWALLGSRELRDGLGNAARAYVTQHGLEQVLQKVWKELHGVVIGKGS